MSGLTHKKIAKRSGRVLFHQCQKKKETAINRCRAIMESDSKTARMNAMPACANAIKESAIRCFAFGGRAHAVKSERGRRRAAAPYLTSYSR